MTSAEVFRTIQLVLAPVVMITSCGIIIGAIVTRYGEINDRMRALAHERLELIRGSPTQPAGPVQRADDYVRERLEEIDHQLPLLLQRHRLLHNSLQALYVAMLVFVVSMFAIGVAEWVDTRATAFGALLVFLGGQVILLIGLLSNAREIHASNQAVEYEARRVQRLREHER